jgi:hypothetical protein
MPAPNTDDPLRTTDHVPAPEPAASSPAGKTSVTYQARSAAESRDGSAPLPSRHPPPSPAKPLRACSAAAARASSTRRQLKANGVGSLSGVDR